jgi:hypothetical protein
MHSDMVTITKTDAGNRVEFSSIHNGTRETWRAYETAENVEQVKAYVAATYPSLKPAFVVVGKVYTAADIERIADAALDVLCRFVQDEIGQTDGGIAGIFWSGSNADLIRDYVSTEITNRNEEI